MSLTTCPQGRLGLRTLKVDRLSIGKATIDIARLPGQQTMSDAELMTWVSTHVQAVALLLSPFFGPPCADSDPPRPSAKDVFGHANGDGGASVLLTLPHKTDLAATHGIWTLTHEMVHLAFPSVHRNHDWIEEGIATHIGPIVRVRVGDLTPGVWMDMVEGNAQRPAGGGGSWTGQYPHLGTNLLGRRSTASWPTSRSAAATTTASLDDALRGIVEAGGNISQEWELTRALRPGTTRRSVPVLMDLYKKMGTHPDARSI